MEMGGGGGEEGKRRMKCSSVNVKPAQLGEKERGTIERGGGGESQLKLTIQGGEASSAK